MYTLISVHHSISPLTTRCQHRIVAYNRYITLTPVMNKNHSSAPGTGHTASLAADDEFGALMRDLAIEAGGQAELAATAREQVLMDHQHKLWASEAQYQQGRMIRESRHEIMERSDTTTTPVRSDEICREELNSNIIAESPQLNTNRSPGQQHPQPGIQPLSRTVLEPTVIPPRLPDIRGYREGKFMSKYDVRYVSNQQMKALASEDPYKDDFYYHTHLRRTEEKLRVGTTPLPSVRTPLSNEAKDEMVKHMKNRNYVTHKKTRAWEEDHKILGHYPRSDSTRPRLLLLLSELKEIDEETSDGEEKCKKEDTGFNSQLWKARVSIMNANDILLNIDELMHILALPGRTADGHIILLKNLQGLIIDLGCSLGLPSQQQLEEENETSSSNVWYRAFESRLDLCLLAKVLELPKGKRMAIRSIPLLHPDQRWALIPSMIAIMLAKRPSSATDSVKIEKEMFGVVKSLILGLNQPAAPLAVVSRCLELILTSHRTWKGSLKTSLGSIARAELLQAILERGSDVCNSTSGGVLESEIQSWKRMHLEFMELVSSS